MNAVLKGLQITTKRKVNTNLLIDFPIYERHWHVFSKRADLFFCLFSTAMRPNQFINQKNRLQILK